MIILKANRDGKTSIILGLEASDFKDLDSNGILQFTLPYVKINIIKVNCSKDEFMKNLGERFSVEEVKDGDSSPQKE